VKALRDAGKGPAAIAKEMKMAGSSRMLDQELVEIEFAFQIVIRRRWKSRRNSRQKRAKLAQHGSDLRGRVRDGRSRARAG